jgi:hypothetical protein
VITSLAQDLKLALDRCAFARALGLEPDGWQEELLCSTSERVLLNCSRQSGKSTISGVIALHRALYYPGSLILCLAPALRQAQELFGKVLGFYRDLGRPISPQGERKLSLELENGSRIVTLPGSEKTIRGFSVMQEVWVIQQDPLRHLCIQPTMIFGHRHSVSIG